MQLHHLSVLAFSLVLGCTEAEETDLPTDTDGPWTSDNRWYTVAEADFPSDLVGAGWQVGDVIPNIEGTDQFGDTVQLHQFYGRTLIIDVVGLWCQPCFDAAPYIENLWTEVQDEAVILTLVQDDVSIEPAGPEHVEQWVEAIGSTNPVISLSADERARFASISEFPSFMVIDPTLRLGTPSMNDPELDPWYPQSMRRLQNAIGGRVGDTEVCDDGIDNGVDGQADCMADVCTDDTACAVQAYEGSIAPCGEVWNRDDNVMDVWTVEATVATQVEVDTRAAETAFETFVYARRPGEDWTRPGVDGYLGDDEIPCAHDVATFACARGFLPAGTWEIAIGAGFGVEGDGDCVNPELGEYALRIQGGTATLTQDDVTPAEF